MDRVDVSTVVYLPREEVYSFLVDFPRYAGYSDHLREVRSYGDGGPGTEYDLEFAWWRLSYTVRSRVTDLDPPNRIDWEIARDLDASGRWALEDAPAPAGRSAATRVRFLAEYDPGSASPESIDLPTFVSLDRVVDRVRPIVFEEAREVVERVVEDLEGEPRPVKLDVHEVPSS